MKLTSKQKKILIAALAVLVLAVLGRINGGQVAVAPGQRDNPTSTVPAAAKEAIVTKIIDGDTVIVSGGDSVRLLGIDADEKGYPCYDAARLRLEELVLEKTVLLETDAGNLDQYGRQLRYVFLNGENINERLVAEGLAIARFYPENQKYKAEIVAAETEAIKNKTGCKWQNYKK